MFYIKGLLSHVKCLLVYFYCHRHIWAQVFKLDFGVILIRRGPCSLNSGLLRSQGMADSKDHRSRNILRGEPDGPSRGWCGGWTSRHILIAAWGSMPRICPHYDWRLPVLFKPQFHEHHKNSVKIEKNTLKLKSTLLCLAFHGLECHLLPPVNKANVNTLPCLLYFMHSIFFTWQSGHLQGNYRSDLRPGKENCLHNI